MSETRTETVDLTVKNPQLEKLASRFVEFSQVQQIVINGVLSNKPPEQILASLPKKNLDQPNDYTPIVAGSIQRFTQIQDALDQWQKDYGLTGIPQELGISSKEARVTRIPGGFCIVLPAEDFIRYLGLKYYQDGKLITDPIEITNLCLHYLPQAGILLDPSEISLTANLPKEASIVVVLDNFKTGRAVKHEEQEIVGRYFDQAIERDRAAKRLEAVARRGVSKEFDQPTVRTAIYDLASRLEGGQTDFNLASIGITPDYAKDHQEEAALLKEVVTNINQLNQLKLVQLILMV